MELRQKDYENMAIYRLKKKVFSLKGLLQECALVVADVLTDETCEEQENYLLNLQKRINAELNIKTGETK